MTDREEPLDRDLLARARAGDDRAFGDLCARYERRLRSWIERRLSPAVRRKISARDVLQEATLVAHQRLGEFEDRGEGSFQRWLSRIVEFKTLEAVRRYVGTAQRAAATEITEGRMEPGVEALGREDSPSAVAVAGEMQEAAKRALAELPPDYRIAIHLIQGEGLTIAAAAARMGRTRESVKGLYSRALAQLAETLGIAARGARRP